MQINTGSDLIEVLLTPEEAHQAKQLSSNHLSIVLLTNTRIGILRQLAEQEFSKPSEDGENHRIRAYLKGQYDLLGSLIAEAVNPGPAPTGDQQQTSPGAN